MTASIEKTVAALSRLKSDWQAAVLLVLLAAVFVFRFFLSEWANLIPDECSYWAWSRQLDWSYFDNSGMVAYLIRLSTELLDRHTPFSVRLPFLVLSALTTYLVYRISFLLFRNRFHALVSAVAFNLNPAFLLGGSAAMHDNSLMFFWMVALWAAARFIRSGQTDWFYVMGAAAGLSIQSKYTGVLLLPSLFIFLLLTKRYRGELLTRKPWLGALIAAGLALPIILWNIEHDWASLHHIFYIGSGSVSVDRRILDGLGYHGAQLALVSPLIYIAMAVATASALFSSWKNPKPEYTVLLVFGLPVVLFGLLAFRGHVEANWAFMGYPSILILSIEIISRGRAAASHRVWRWFGPRFQKWAMIFVVVPVAVVLLHAWIGILPASLEARLGKADRIVWETWGWDDLGKHVGSLITPNDVIAADSYQLCALLEFNIPGNPKVRYLAPWNRPTQFDIWNPSFDDLTARHILYVSTRPLQPSSSILTTVFENFSKVEPLPVYRVMYHGVAIRDIYLYVGHDFNPVTPRRLGPRSLRYTDY